MTSSRPLNSPRSSAVFSQFAMTLFYLRQAKEQRRKKSGPPRQIFEDDVLVPRMRTIACRPETI
jgi:hypothetical protein